LAELLDVRPSSLNERLVLLEQEELIRRERDPNDQRVFLVELLPKGKQHLDTIIQEQRKFNEELGKILTKEESETFVFLTEKLAKGLEPLTTTEEKKRRHHHHSKKDYL
jgi:DNA-binding MarR family transcriptional regulator